ncbi:hypothetical protein SDC9_134317 [bioreactor metagenome]|uniref:Uncharacterized protein n=1 Tax=bioreactor metagenome TaxID=1076179 RepID=A0A645DEE8_9ZZZZ
MIASTSSAAEVSGTLRRLSSAALTCSPNCALVENCQRPSKLSNWMPCSSSANSSCKWPHRRSTTCGSMPSTSASFSVETGSATANSTASSAALYCFKSNAYPLPSRFACNNSRSSSSTVTRPAFSSSSTARNVATFSLRPNER